MPQRSSLAPKNEADHGWTGAIAADHRGEIPFCQLKDGLGNQGARCCHGRGLSIPEVAQGGTNQGFPRIVFDSCEDLELELRSLAHSFGYASLLNLRNVAQMEDFKKAQLEQVPAWQRQSVVLKKQRLTRAVRQGLTQRPQTLTITIPEIPGQAATQISVVRPAHPNDDLVIESCVVALGCVVHYLRHEGFDQNPERAQRGTGTKGVWKWRDQFVVCGSLKNGGKRRRLFKSLDDAVGFKEQLDAGVVTIDVEVESADGDHDGVAEGDGGVQAAKAEHESAGHAECDGNVEDAEAEHERAGQDGNETDGEV